MPYVKLNSEIVHYSDEGYGHALIMLHGTGGDAVSNWGEVVKRLPETRRIIRPDFVGSGKSSAAQQDLSVDDLLRQVIAVADHAGCETFDLVGFSLGAVTAALVAGRHPERVNRLLLLSGFMKGSRPRLARQFALWRRLALQAPEDMAELVMLTGFSPPYIEALNSDQLAEIVDTIAIKTNWSGMVCQINADLHADIEGDVSKITASVLVIGAAYDHMVPPAHAKDLHYAISHSQYVEVDSGHTSPMEIPDVIADLIIAHTEM